MGEPKSDIELFSFSASRSLSHVVNEIGKYIEVPTKEYLELDGVRITPSSLVFENVYEGKTFELTMTIQNCGKKTAFIRICPPRSHAFKMKPVIRGKHLCPGLKITKLICYTPSLQTTSHISGIPIYINGKYLDYIMKVRVPKTIITVDPECLDFGKVDTGHTAATRTLRLNNIGWHDGRYAIDLGRNEHDLVVDPMKGVIPAKSTASLRVEVMGTVEGDISQEFWIKAEPLSCVRVKATFIQPNLKAHHPNANTSFTLVEFPRTYYGTRIFKTLLVQNCSATDAMFCIMAQVEESKMNLNDARECDPNFLNFHIWPGEGRLEPYETRIFEVIFTPKPSEKVKKGAYYHNHAVCFVQILRVDCKGLHKVAFEASDNRLLLEDEIACPSPSSTSLGFISLEEDLAFTYPTLDYMEQVTKQEVASWRDTLRVCFYGQGETANVAVRPDTLNLVDLVIKQPVTRELLIKNESSVLPIIFRYKKVPFIEVKPKEYSIQPSESLEVQVTITPNNYGPQKTKIFFYLLHYNYPRKKGEYVIVGDISITVTFDVPTVVKHPQTRFNMGITPEYIGEVGYNVEDVRFNTNLEVPKTAMPVIHKKELKDNNNLIAFPNDRPKCLRPWKNDVRCTTMFAGMPRNNVERDEYMLSHSQEDIKENLKGYYRQYTKEEASRLRDLYDKSCHAVSDYILTNPTKLLLDKMTCPVSCKTKTKTSVKKAAFISLTPSELYNIDVIPRRIRMDWVAPYTRSFERFTIKNNNSISIRAYIKPRRTGFIELPQGNRFVIKPYKEEEVNVCYKSKISGRNNVTLDVIINECQVFSVTIQVDVVPKFVRNSVNTLRFDSTDSSNRKFIDLWNPFNVSVPFYWEGQTECFSVEPLYGAVPPKEKITCMVTYTPYTNASLTAELILSSDVGLKQTMTVSAYVKKSIVALSTDNLVMKSVPLNIETTEKFVLRNLSSDLVTFEIKNPEPMPGIRVDPTKGVLNSFGDQRFVISVKISDYISFICSLKIVVQNLQHLNLEIKGSVGFPNIVVQPNYMELRKIVVGSIDQCNFMVENRGDTQATLEFDFEDFQEFCVSEMKYGGTPFTSKDVLTLAPQDYKELWLHFAATDVAPNNFILPLIINGILDPPYRISSDSVNVSKYLTSETNQIITLTPPKVQCIQIKNSATTRILKIAPLNFEFSQYDKGTGMECNTESKVRFKNVDQNNIMEFCIRLDEFNSNFNMQHLDGGFVERHEFSYRCRLTPGSKMYFSIAFTPKTHGKFSAKAPIFLNDVLEGNLFNYIKLTGTFYAPLIKLEEPIIYLQLTPLKVRSERRAIVEMLHHKKDCRIFPKTAMMDLRITIQTTMFESSSMGQKKEILVSYGSCDPNCIDIKTAVYCTCGASLDLYVKGGVDNCCISNHVFLELYFFKFFEDPQSDALQNTFPLFTYNEVESKPSDTFSGLSTFGTGDFSELILDNNENDFPLFPDDTDMGCYAKHMRNIVKVLENWLYTQIFRKKQYCKIPEDVAASPIFVQRKVEKGTISIKPYTSELVIVHVLMVLVGNNILKFIKPVIKKTATENAERVAYSYSTYYNVLKLLKHKKAHFPHVEPEYLLEYEDYLIYLKCVLPEEQPDARLRMPYDPKTFIRLHTQCWIDVILQTYKIFVLARLKIPKQALSRLCVINPNVGSMKLHRLTNSSKRLLHSVEWPTFTRFLEEQINSNMAIFYSREETVLLTWLLYNFRRYSEKCWPNNVDNLSQRKVDNFCSDLCDSVVLITITIGYCPYLKQYLRNVYLTPQSYEELFHNACQLIQALERINCSFTLTPKSIIFANVVEMVMLTAYLYEVLPCFRPFDNVVIKSSLSLMTENKVFVKNESKSTVVYEIVVFDNQHECFILESETLKIPPKKEGTLTVKYHAKKLRRVHAVVVLTGDTPGNSYAKGIAFRLEGVPDPSYCCQEIPLNPYLYDFEEITLTIQSPYQQAANYDIYVLDHKPVSIDDMTSLTKYEDIKKLNIPRFSYVEQNQISTDENGLAEVFMTTYAMWPREANPHIYFINEDVGTFCVNFLLKTVNKRRKFEKIHVTLPKDYPELPCICEENDMNTKCPRTICMHLPCKNNLMWECITNIYMVQTAEPREKEFWKKYLGTPCGMHLLQWFFKASKSQAIRSMLEMFKKNVKYNLVTGKKQQSRVTLPTCIEIEDNRSSDTISVPIHLNTSDEKPKDFFFDLIQDNKNEYRFYKVIFDGNIH